MDGVGQDSKKGEGEARRLMDWESGREPIEAVAGWAYMYEYVVL